jgi:hypothetical protein
MQTHKLIMQQKQAQKVQARAQYETLEQQRKGRLANAAVSGISDLMKSNQISLPSSLMMQLL